MTYTLYLLEFVDGTQYVGYTSRDPEERIAEHRTRSCNPGVAARMRLGMPFAWSVLGRYIDLSACITAERLAIRKYPHTLNGIATVSYTHLTLPTTPYV